MKDDQYFSYFIVVYFDLLGQKELLKRFKKLPDKSNETEYKEFVELFRSTFGRVRVLFEGFETFFKALYNPRKRSIFRHLFSATGVKYQRFSDGCVIFMPLMDIGNNIPVEETYGILLACCSVFISFLAEGIPIRGGVDVGLGFELFDNEIYGPVVAQAAYLESKVAQYPRIVVGDVLYEYLYDAAGQIDTDIRAKINKRMADNGLELIIRDHDGNLILDYMGKAFREATTKWLPIEDYIKVYNFAREEQKNGNRREIVN